MFVRSYDTNVAGVYLNAICGDVFICLKVCSPTRGGSNAEMYSSLLRLHCLADRHDREHRENSNSSTRGGFEKPMI